MRSTFRTKRSGVWWIAIPAVLSLLFAGCQRAQEGVQEQPTAGATSPSPAASPATQASVRAVDSSLGRILADSEGRTLYLFMNDTQGESTCYDACQTRWAPIVVTGQAQAGEGADATLLGTTQRRDGNMQVTYKGHPLYHFAEDQAPGETKGQGVGGVWYVVSPEGEPVR